jgi:DnaK suppressor protein
MADATDGKKRARKNCRSICRRKMHGRVVAMQGGIGKGKMHSQLAKQALESKLSETTNPAGWRDSIAVRTNADPTDTTQQIGEREMASRNLSRNASLVRDLRAALNRVAQGTYGVCIDCEQPIATKRLAAVPWTPRCLSCQSDLEAGAVEDERLAA